MPSSKTRQSLSFLLLIAVPYSLAWLLSWQVRDYSYQMLYELTHYNPAVTSVEKIDERLARFEVLSLSELPREYRERSKISAADYAPLFRDAVFYEVPPKAIYQRIAGKVQIKDLMSRDEFYAASIRNRDRPIYWRLDKRILYKVIALQKLLAERGFDDKAFHIRSGYRTPKRNEEVGGASRSHHMKGHAVDLVIGDINRDGRYTGADKDLVIRLLEEEIIRDEGGIGRYPGTRAVHMDVRGYRARWNQQ